MKKFLTSLPAKLLLGIIVGIVIGLVVPESVMKIMDHWYYFEASL